MESKLSHRRSTPLKPPVCKKVPKPPPAPPPPPPWPPGFPATIAVNGQIMYYPPSFNANISYTLHKSGTALRYEGTGTDSLGQAWSCIFITNATFTAANVTTTITGTPVGTIIGTATPTFPGLPHGGGWFDSPTDHEPYASLGQSVSY
jgi:hypothetical protein